MSGHGRDEADNFAALVYEGMTKRWGDPAPPEIVERIDFELNVIKMMGFSSYFLSVHDYVEAARRMGVWIGPVHGSAAGSAVLYALGVTAVDPIKHGLLFERFLTHDRISLPDIDIDVEEDGLEKVVEYIREQHGCGLKILSVHKRCVNLIKERSGRAVDLDKIPFDEPETMEVFARGDTGHVFQFESEDMKRWLMALKPKCFGDLVAMVPLYYMEVADYIPRLVRRKNGEEPVTYNHPLMEEILCETYGITVYQEQIMTLSRKLAGFTRGESDKLRKALGKKVMEVMRELKDKFVAGCLANPDFRIGEWRDEAVARSLCAKIWKDWEAFASYAFNKSHAVSYAHLAYQTAYLKAHYPAEFAESLGGER